MTISNWLKGIQENIIREKYKTMEVLQKDIALNSEIKEKSDDPKIIFLLESMIQEASEYIELLSKSIKQNREMIKKYGKQNKNNILI